MLVKAEKMDSGIATVMQEKRLFPAPAEFAARARIKSLDEYTELWEQAAADPPKFWAELAREELHWFKPFTKSLDWNEPFARWFVGGTTNPAHNCLDRNLAAKLGDRTAIIWEGEPGDARTLTYAELAREVSKFANAVKSPGVGGIPSVIFAGFSAEAISEPTRDAEAKMQITADGSWRRGKMLALKAT